MPGWPRLVLAVIAFGISALNGIETGEGNLDLVGGICMIAAVVWPGCEFTTTTPDGSRIYPLGRRKIGWPSLGHVHRAVREFGGQSDGLVLRSWSFPFSARWAAARDYRELERADR